MKQKWNELLRETGQLLDKNREKNTRIAWIRAVLFLGTAWSFFNLVDGKRIWWIVMIPCLLLFVLALNAHQKNREQKNYLSARISVLQHCLNRLDGSWKQEEADLSGFPEDPVWQDLDLFSSQSLFQFINMTTLPQGKETLIRWMSTLSSLQETEQRQKSVQALLSDPDFLIEEWTQAHRLDKKQRKALSHDNLEQSICAVPLPVDEKVIHLMPCLVAGLFVLASLHWISPVFFLIFFFLQWALALFSMGQVSSAIHQISALKEGLQCCMDRLEVLKKSSLHCPVTDQLKSMIQDPQGIYANMHRIDRILDLFSVRANPFLSLPLQLILLWDLQTAVAWNHLQKKTGPLWVSLMDQLGQLEALESLCMIGLTHKNHCFPQFHTEIKLEFTDLIHPLIPQEKAVGNSAALDHSITLITGSNMSGKTTFMRTVGLNQILAQAGGCVCGSSMETSLFTVLTSMKITDNVNEGISTFYQELLRIRRIMDQVKEKQPLLILIDEIFKGTNSPDRIEGGKRVLKHLDCPQVRAMVTTHDEELCDLEEKLSSLVNVHFEEEFHENRISFDYRLKPGRCRKRNARYLMKMIGLDD